MSSNRVTLDKYLMAGFIGLLMIAAGLSSIDKWWAVIGAVVLGLTLLFAAIDIYGWIKRSGDGRVTPESPPSKLRVVTMLPICLLLAAGLIWLGGSEGIILAAVLVLSYAALLFLTFVSPKPVRLFLITTSLPVATGNEDARELREAINTNPDSAEKAIREHLAEHPVVPDSALWRAIDAISGLRLQQSLEDAVKTSTVERTPDGFVMKRDVNVTLDSPPDMVETVLSAIGGRAARQARPTPATTAATQTATLLAQGDDLKTRGLLKEARDVYEKAEAHAVVDLANGETEDRSLLPTILIRLGKLDAARALLSEALATAPEDERLLAAQALLDAAPDSPREQRPA